MLICEKTVFLLDKKGLIVSQNSLLPSFSYLMIHNIFFFPSYITYYKSFV